MSLPVIFCIISQLQPYELYLHATGKSHLANFLQSEFLLLVVRDEYFGRLFFNLLYNFSHVMLQIRRYMYFISRSDESTTFT